MAVMRRYGMQVFSIDKEQISPRFVCPLCLNVGLRSKDIMKEGIDRAYCYSCGFLFKEGMSETDENILFWKEAWLQCGSVALYDLEYEARLDKYCEIKTNYLKHFYIFASDDELSARIIPHGLFEQHGYECVKDSNKRILVKHGKDRYSFEYETNKIFFLGNENIYFAIGHKNGSEVLFASAYLAKGDWNVDAMRGFYYGLNPDYFDLNADFSKAYAKVVVDDSEAYEFCVKPK